MRVTIAVKAFNEERHIASALSSAVSAAEAFDGEVVLADSLSSDRTVAIASNFPVRIVQLANESQRSCGATAQLAFQNATGEYFYLMDGDMILDAAFLPAAFAFLERHPHVAAVGGHVQEMHLDNEEFRIRAGAQVSEPHRMPGFVDRLDGGGLYRTAAVQEAGYFADRNLHAFEEFELATRLRSLGWKLARIDHKAVDHFGHRIGGYKLLWRRFASGYAGAAGEVLRAAAGQRHFWTVLRGLRHVWYSFAVFVWWMALLASVAIAGSTMLLVTLLLAPLALLSLRRGSIMLGIYSFASWNLGALGMMRSLLRRRQDPHRPISSVTLSGNPSASSSHTIIEISHPVPASMTRFSSPNPLA